MEGFSNELTLSFYDQSMLPLGTIDSNVGIRILMRPIIYTPADGAIVSQIRNVFGNVFEYLAMNNIHHHCR